MKKILYLVFALIIILIVSLGQKHTTKKAENPMKQKYFGVNIAGPEFEIAQYPESNDSYTYFKNNGLDIIRIPFKWERIQPTPQQPFLDEDYSNFVAMVQTAGKSGVKIIIEPHNFGRYYEQPMTTHDTQKFADLWSRLADTFKDTPGIWGYELMNEPHDLPGGCNDWRQLSQAAIDAIREKDKAHYILIPGYSWQSAVDWEQQSSCLADLADPQNKLIYAAHTYFDDNKSGRYTSSCVDTTIGRERAKPFLDWLKANNKIGMFTEYGVPPDSCWMTTLDTFLQDIYDDPQIIGGLYWAAGPGWGEYPLSIEPQDNQDKPQMHILKKYPTK